MRGVFTVKELSLQMLGQMFCRVKKNENLSHHVAREIISCYGALKIVSTDIKICLQCDYLTPLRFSLLEDLSEKNIIITAFIDTLRLLFGGSRLSSEAQTAIISLYSCI